MITEMCKNCIHYYQHYVLSSDRCTAVNCGHCMHPRRKHREPDHPACVHYERCASPPDLPDREGVVNFLTTEMLEFVLRLKLPPAHIDSWDRD